MTAAEEALKAGEAGPAEAKFHWSGLNETFLCNNLNEVMVAQRAREGFALANLGGSGGMLPRKILFFWTLQNAILGALANFSYIIECYFARSLGERNRICAHANEMHRYAFTRSFGSSLLNYFSTVQRARISPTSREAGMRNVTMT